MEEKLIRSHLQLLGLRDEEISVYLALVTHGSMPISKLSQVSNVERTALYRMLDDLEQRGIINIQEANKRKIISPQLLSHLVKDEELRIQKLKSYEQDFNDIVNSLTGAASKTRFKYHYGIESIKQAIMNNLSTQNADIYSLAIKPMEQALDYLFTDAYSSMLLDKKITNSVVVNENYSSNCKPIRYAEIPEAVFKITKQFDVFDSTTVYYSWSNDPVAVEIRDKDIASNNRELVKLLLKCTDNCTHDRKVNDHVACVYGK